MQGSKATTDVHRASAVGMLTRPVLSNIAYGEFAAFSEQQVALYTQHDAPRSMSMYVSGTEGEASGTAQTPRDAVTSAADLYMKETSVKQLALCGPRPIMSKTGSYHACCTSTPHQPLEIV